MATLCRKAAMKLVEGACKSVSHYRAGPGGVSGSAPLSTRSGRHSPSGWAWSTAWPGPAVGGELLEVEVNVVPGSGKVELTGNLGDVMKESRPRSPQLYPQPGRLSWALPADFYKNRDIHVHFPEGAVPKDGPFRGHRHHHGHGVRSDRMHR